MIVCKFPHELDGLLVGRVPSLLTGLRFSGPLDADVPAEVGEPNGQVDEIVWSLKEMMNNKLVLNLYVLFFKVFAFLIGFSILTRIVTAQLIVEWGCYLSIQ